MGTAPTWIIHICWWQCIEAYSIINIRRSSWVFPAIAFATVLSLSDTSQKHQKRKGMRRTSDNLSYLAT